MYRHSKANYMTSNMHVSLIWYIGPAASFHVKHFHAVDYNRQTLTITLIVSPFQINAIENLWNIEKKTHVLISVLFENGSSTKCSKSMLHRKPILWILSLRMPCKKCAISFTVFFSIFFFFFRSLAIHQRFSWNHILPFNVVFFIVGNKTKMSTIERFL